MKPLQQQVLAELAGRFGYAVNALEPLGGGKESSDGVTYRVRREGQPFVFKVIGANAENP